jgi:hypothetical protein
MSHNNLRRASYPRGDGALRHWINTDNCRTATTDGDILPLCCHPEYLLHNTHGLRRRW